ncbi:MAG: hypothetical protein RRY54_05690, partial [Angelakisella sp.]
MLQVPRLDDLDYKALMDRARAMIPTLTDEWTDLNDHDPGITTLQVFAWLCDGLNYYINATGEQHRLKYLKLLGIEPARAAAHCRVAIGCPDGQPFSLPRGTRLLAGDTVFELTAPCVGIGNRMLRLYTKQQDTMLDLTAFAGQDGEFATVFSSDGQSGELELGFSGPLSERVELFVEIKDCGRTPFFDDFSLAAMSWEAYDGAAWQTVKMLADETGGLLRSGVITLELPCETALYSDEQLEAAHYLRCRLTRNEYDMAPKVGRVVLNCAEAEQVRSYSEALLLTYDGSGVLPIDRYIGEDDLLTVFVENGEGYLSCEDLYEVEAGSRLFLRNIRFDEARFGYAPQAGAKILVVVTEAEIAEELLLGETDGCARQQFEFAVDNLLSLRLALIDKNT